MSPLDYGRIVSTIDESINYSKPTADGGMIETRFVRRIEDRFIIYISSMTGCDKACRHCHLTQTKQVMATHLSHDEMIEQARVVLQSSDISKSTLVHFNFMARGEPMSNTNVNASLFIALKNLATQYGLESRIKISSIFPLDFKFTQISEIYNAECPPVDFYYSLYSLDTSWRKRWLPKAASPDVAFRWLANFQKNTGNRVILHWAIIHGENDSPETIPDIINYVKSFGIRFDFNLVHYNPPNSKSQIASESTKRNYLLKMKRHLSGVGRVKDIPRVGFDVKASCGMFLSPAEQ